MLNASPDTHKESWKAELLSLIHHDLDLTLDSAWELFATVWRATTDEDRAAFVDLRRDDSDLIALRRMFDASVAAAPAPAPAPEAPAKQRTLAERERDIAKVNPELAARIESGDISIENAEKDAAKELADRAAAAVAA